MKVKIVSDIILNPFVKELHELGQHIKADFDYQADLPAYLQNANAREMSK